MSGYEGTCVDLKNPPSAAVSKHGTHYAEEPNEVMVNTVNPIVMTSKALDANNVTAGFNEADGPRGRSASWCQDKVMVNTRSEVNDHSMCRPRSISGKHHSVIDIIHSTTM